VRLTHVKDEAMSFSHCLPWSTTKAKEEVAMVESSHKSGHFPSLADQFRNLGSQVADWFAPASEAAVDEKRYRISLEVPGVEEKDIDVSVNEGMVTVTGKKSSEREEKGETWFFSERSYGSFSRSFRLPPDADEKKVDATLKDGLLTINLPKKAGTDAAKGKKVKIKKE
jgi:HSP20 family protein